MLLNSWFLESHKDLEVNLESEDLGLSPGSDSPLLSVSLGKPLNLSERPVASVRCHLTVSPEGTIMMISIREQMKSGHLKSLGQDVAFPPSKADHSGGTTLSQEWLLCLVTWTANRNKVMWISNLTQPSTLGLNPMSHNSLASKSGTVVLSL